MFCLCNMSPKELLLFSSVVSIVLSDGLNKEDINLLGSFISLVGDGLSTIATQMETCAPPSDTNSDTQDSSNSDTQDSSNSDTKDSSSSKTKDNSNSGTQGSSTSDTQDNQVKNPQNSSNIYTLKDSKEGHFKEKKQNDIHYYKY